MTTPSTKRRILTVFQCYRCQTIQTRRVAEDEIIFCTQCGGEDLAVRKQVEG